jgi:carbonic anhydrase
MDARIDPQRAFGMRPGDAHVIRNAGAVATDDVIRSLAVSQRLLGTTDVVVVGHTGCGMAGLDTDSLSDTIEADTGLRPPFAFEAFPDPQTGVRRSVARIKASPFLPHRDRVRGFVYDIETGAVTEVS